MAQADSLGATLNDLLQREYGVRPEQQLKSYRAREWHAQLAQLTKTHRGYEALERAGLSVTAPTLMRWLADAEYTVRRSYRDIIRAAYRDAARIPADPIPQAFKDREFRIYGKVKTGSDERDRGAEGTAPFLIDGSQGNWSDIEEKWAAGELTDENFEDLFIDIIVDDIGEGSDGWEFPGGSYTII